MNTNEPNLNTSSKKKRGINVFVLLFSIIIIFSILSYVLPAGEYQREMVNDREVVVQGSYQQIESTPVTFLQAFGAMHSGMVQASSIIFYVLIIGGAFGVLNSTGAIDAMIGAVAKKNKNNDFIFILLIMLVLSLGGALIAMAEESIVYITLIMPFILALGFDSVTAAAVVLLGMGVGFTTAILNPFTVGIAQGIAGLPLFSGLWLRVILYVIMFIVTVLYVYNYARKVKKNPSKGYLDPGIEVKSAEDFMMIPFTVKHKLVLLALASTLVIVAIGTGMMGWYMSEMAGIFFVFSLVTMFIMRLEVEDFIDRFVKGAQNMVVGALVIGIARGIVVVLSEGHLIDTILYHASGFLAEVPPTLCVIGMFFVQAVIHFLVPSGSGQAMLTMPIMLPLAELVGVSQQTACLIFTLADGIGNTILPTVGYFMAVLAIAKIPYQVWLRKMGPLMLIWYGISLVAVIIANALNYGPF